MFPTRFRVGRCPARLRSISRFAISSAASCTRTGKLRVSAAEAHSSIVAGLGALISTDALNGVSRSGNLPTICCRLRRLSSRSLCAAISWDTARS